ncbi:MAG: peptidyl-prolyl cis-trans isomerase [Myxococcota bacterium]|nr:peptidyl-prolyl cis-trans isomerase [Myxococcota bacterium]
MVRLSRAFYGSLVATALILIDPGLTRSETIVATGQHDLGEFKISASRLATFLKSNPMLTPRDGLEKLIDFEVLAAAAQKAGFEDEPSVMHRRREVMVQKFLTGWFEPKWTAKTLPEPLVKRSYEANRGRFVRPQLRVADHLLVTQNKKRPADPVVDKKAKQLADDIYGALRTTAMPSRDAFVALASTYADRAAALGLSVLGQDLGRFAKKGRYDPKFTEPVFEATTVPSIMPPFVTRFGYHIVRLDSVLPKKNESFAAAEGDLRVRIVPEVRTMKLIELTDELAAELPKLSRAPGARGLANFAPLAALDVRPAPDVDSKNTDRRPPLETSP